MKYIPPQLKVNSFTCSHCGVISRQYHHSSRKELNGPVSNQELNIIKSTVCEHCGNITLWLIDKMIYPDRGIAPLPNSDMPDEIKNDYEEAAAISQKSPRGAAALLRLAIQKLCVQLGGKGKNINEDIAHLVKNGLPSKIQKSLDIVRVIGNNAVHPGQINTDNEEVVGNLFQLLNIIIEYMISMPNRIDGLYDDLPEGAKNAIKKRDEGKG